jgi:integrase
MKQTFEKVAPGIYRREYRTAAGLSVLYYGRLTLRSTGERELFALGPNLKEAKDQFAIIKVKNRRKEDLSEFKPTKKADALPEVRDGKATPFTFAEWAEKYPTFDDVKRKRSLADDVRMARLHLTPFFGSALLTEITREGLVRYIDRRTGETLIRCGKASKKSVHRGTVSNELSLLRRMLRVAARESYKVAVPSFDDLIVRTKRGGRALSAEEQQKVLAVYSPWMRRLAEFAKETCLSEGDLLRLTDDMVDRAKGVIVPEGGRKKTDVEQVSPLTARARAILDEIRSERRKSGVAPLSGLVFTREDGRPVTKDMIQSQVERAIKVTGVKKFTFHNYRNTALTEWSRQKIAVDVAMKASGHSSVQMHKRYVDLQQEDVAAAFGTGRKLVDITGEQREGRDARNVAK